MKVLASHSAPIQYVFSFSGSLHITIPTTGSRRSERESGEASRIGLASHHTLLSMKYGRIRFSAEAEDETFSNTPKSINVFGKRGDKTHRNMFSRREGKFAWRGRVCLVSKITSELPRDAGPTSGGREREERHERSAKNFIWDIKLTYIFLRERERN